jgi:hypothetical protein
MAYTLQEGDDPRWLLYTEPLRLPVGQTTVRARAIRIGYKESKESKAIFTVIPQCDAPKTQVHRT